MFHAFEFDRVTHGHKRAAVVSGVTILLVVGAWWSMKNPKDQKEPIPVSLNQEFVLRKGEEAVVQGIRLAFEGYARPSRHGEMTGVVAKFKASLDGGATVGFGVEELRGVDWAVLSEKEEFHIVVVKFVKKVSSNALRLSVLESYTIRGREKYQKWYEETILGNPED